MVTTGVRSGRRGRRIIDDQCTSPAHDQGRHLKYQRTRETKMEERRKWPKEEKIRNEREDRVENLAKGPTGTRHSTDAYCREDPMKSRKYSGITRRRKTGWSMRYFTCEARGATVGG